MIYNFLRPEDEATIDVFESKIVELAMKVDRDLGSFEEAASIANSVYEKVLPYLSDEEFPKVMMLLNHFKLLEELATKEQDNYLDLQAELNSYITGNFVWDERTRELIYLDHKNFTHKYPNFDGTLQK